MAAARSAAPAGSLAATARRAFGEASPLPGYSTQTLDRCREPLQKLPLMRCLWRSTTDLWRFLQRPSARWQNPPRRAVPQRLRFLIWRRGCRHCHDAVRGELAGPGWLRSSPCSAGESCGGSGKCRRRSRGFTVLAPGWAGGRPRCASGGSSLALPSAALDGNRAWLSLTEAKSPAPSRAAAGAHRGEPFANAASFCTAHAGADCV